MVGISMGWARSPRARARKVKAAVVRKWRSFLTQLRKHGPPVDFVSALAACAEDEVYGALIPSSIHLYLRKTRDNAGEAEVAA